MTTNINGAPVYVSDGTVTYNINTKEGANQFLRSGVGVSSLLKQIRSLRNKKRLNARDKTELNGLFQFFPVLADNADDLSPIRVPESELQDWLNYFIDVIKTCTNKHKWINSGTLDGSDHCLFLVLGNILFGGSHGVPADMAFESGFFQVVVNSIRAQKRNGRNLPEAFFCCFVGQIVHGTLVSACRPGWSPEIFFKKLSRSGILEEFLRCSTVSMDPLVVIVSSAGASMICDFLTKLGCWAGFLTRSVFKTGKPCRDTLKAIIDGRDGSRNIQPEILKRLQDIEALLETMDPSGFHERYKVCGACNSCSKLGNCEAPLSCCARCRLSFYCSKECQRARWKSHKRICQERSDSNVSRNISLHMAAVKFMNQHFEIVFEEIHKKCDSAGLQPSDLAVEVDFMPDEDGLIPALQKPPIFSIVHIQDYMSEGIRSDLLTDSERTVLTKRLTECTDSYAALVLHYGYPRHIDGYIIDAFRCPDARMMFRNVCA